MDKVFENRLRRVAVRRGLVLVKSRRRDRGCPWFGKWVLLERWGDRVLGLVHGRGLSLVPAGKGMAGLERFGQWLDLVEVERLLDSDLFRRAPAMLEHGVSCP